MSDRDMYYSGFGYGGFTPQGFPVQNNTIPQMGPVMNSQTPTNMMGNMPSNTYTNSQFNDINERVSRLERQVKRLDQRLTRLETPYANTNSFQGNEPDNNMYMM